MHVCSLDILIKTTDALSSTILSQDLKQEISHGWFDLLDEKRLAGGSSALYSCILG